MPTVCLPSRAQSALPTSDPAQARIHPPAISPPPARTMQSSSKAGTPTLGGAEVWRRAEGRPGLGRRAEKSAGGWVCGSAGREGRDGTLRVGEMADAQQDGI